MPATPVFPTSQFAFDQQNIDIERRTISGGIALSGDEDVISTDGGGRVFAEFSGGPLLDRETILSWRAQNTGLDGGVTAIIVPFCDKEHTPYAEGEEATASVRAAAALRATTLSLTIDLPTPLLGGEWFAIEHPTKGWRAYNIKKVTGQTSTSAIVEFGPPLREAVDIGDVVDFADPKCLMVQQGAVSNATDIGRYGEAAIRFVEAPGPFDFNPLTIFADGSDGFWYDFSRRATLYRTVGFAAPLTGLEETVGYVRDLSGNENHAGQNAPVSERPLFGLSPEGIPGIYFDGVDDFLDVVGLIFDAAGATTIVASVKTVPLETTSTVAQVIYGEMGSSSGALYYLSSATGRSVAEDADGPAKLRFGIKTNAAVTGSLDSQEAFADDQIRVVSMRDNALSLETWIDDRKNANTATRTGSFTLTNGGIGAIPGSSPNSFFKGWIFGILGVKTALSDADLLKLQTWFATRYYSPYRAAEGEGTIPVRPRVTAFNGRPLIGTVTQTAGIRLTDLGWDGKFRGRAYSPFSMGAVHGDGHMAPAILPLADGRLVAGWTDHNLNRHYIRVTTGPSIEPGGWETTRNFGVSELGLNRLTYASFTELSSGVFTFVRGRLPAETNSEVGYWYSSVKDPSDAFPAATKFIAGDEPYIMFAKNGPDRVDFLVSTGNPALTADVSMYHCYMAIDGDGDEHFFDSDDNPLTLPMDVTDMNLIHDGTVNPSWIEDITIGADGKPRVLYIVYYDEISDQAFWHGRWTGSAWVVHQVDEGGGPTQDVGLDPNNWIANGNASFDPDDPSVVYCGRLTDAAPVHQIWRYVTTDDGVTWSGVQITDEPKVCYEAFAVAGLPEPRLTYTTGDQADFDDWDLRVKLVNSVTGEVE